MTDALHPTLGSAIHALRRNWGWFVGLGVLSIVAGLLALGNVMIGTLVSVLFIGAMMTVAGIGHMHPHPRPGGRAHACRRGPARALGAADRPGRRIRATALTHHSLPVDRCH